MSMRKKSISATVLLQMLRYIDSIGMDRRKVLETAGISAELLNTPDVRIPAEQYLAAQSMAAQQSGDPWFGLHMGEASEVSSWAILGYIIMTCSTLEQSIEKMQRYSRALSDMIQVTVQPWGTGTEVWYSMADGFDDSRHCIEASISSQIRLFQKITGGSFCPDVVCFPYPYPGESAVHQQLFGSAASFNEPGYGLKLSRATLETPIPSTNPHLLGYFEHYALQRLNESEHQSFFVRRISEEISQNLANGDFAISQVAHKLSISVRSLQSRLKREGTRYSKLLDNIRMRRMEDYLQQGLSTDDVAFLLGFSEPAVLRKACLKWTGQTLAQYRESLASDFLKGPTGLA